MWRPTEAGAAPGFAGRASSAEIGRWSCRDRRRLAPARWVPARSQAGIQAFSRESPDAKSRGGWPPAPPFLWPARSHSLVLAWWGAARRFLDYFVTHLCALIWKLSFAKMLFQHIFPENASQIGLSTPNEIAPQPHQRQRSQKSRGGAPALFLPISREKWGPPPGRRGNGALRPEAPEKPRPPVGYVVPAAPRRVGHSRHPPPRGVS